MTDTTTKEAAPFIEGLHFGECPRWHDGRLWYVDFYAGTVVSTDEDANTRIELEVPGEPAGIGWLPDGRLLVVARKPRTVLRLEPDGQLVEHGDLKPMAGFYGNDMVVDPAGRAYVGNFGFDLDGFIEERGPVALVEPPGPPTTPLIRIDPDGSAHIAADDISFPNGTVITPDGGDDDPRRDAGRPPHRFRRRSRRRAQRATGLGRAALVRARRHLPRRRRKRVGGQRHLPGVLAGHRGR